MSFGDLESGPRGAEKTRPKQWVGEDSTFEVQIRANIREIQENVRLAREQLDRSWKCSISKRLDESLNRSLERSHDLSQETELLFRDWTVHLAGEPSARHKKKFSYEKLQKALRDESDHIKDLSRQAKSVRQEALHADGRGSSSSAVEFHGICEDQGASVSDEEHCLLATSEISDVADEIQNRIVQEREEGIRRIQSQVSDVNRMFHDLASIVSDQGQAFETIEQQAEASSSNTKLAVKELKKTSDRQRSHFERLCCMLAAAMLVLCFVVVSNMPHLQGASHPEGSHPGASHPAGIIQKVLS